MSSERLILGIHHIEITVPRDKESEALSFYRDFLGLEQIAKPESLRHRGGFWLRLGNLDLHVGIEDGVNRLATKVHIAYQVTDIAMWRRRIEQAGLTVRDSIPIPGHNRFEFRDPFGNRVEMIQATDSRE